MLFLDQRQIDTSGKRAWLRRLACGAAPFATFRILRSCQLFVGRRAIAGDEHQPGMAAPSIPFSLWEIEHLEPHASRAPSRHLRPRVAAPLRRPRRRPARRSTFWIQRIVLTSLEQDGQETPFVPSRTGKRKKESWDTTAHWQIQEERCS